MKKNKKLFQMVVAGFCVVLVGIIMGRHFVRGAANCSVKVSNGSSINMNDMMDCVEEHYGFDQDSLRRSNQKQNMPKASIFFDITSPQEGEKVTATVVPQQFKNATENLYYTWYIIHTDEDGNPTNTIEEGKKEAMGKVAGGSFDPDLFGTDYDTDKTKDPDVDSYWAPIGGSDGVGAQSLAEEGTVCQNESGENLTKNNIVDHYEEKIYWNTKKQVVSSYCTTRCVKHNFGEQSRATSETDSAGTDQNAGKDMIIECAHEYPKCDDFVVGDGAFTTEEEECWETDPASSDTDGDGILDEADLAGLNQQQFTWKYKKGDRVGVVVEGTTTNPSNESTMNSYYKIAWATPGICSDEADGFIDKDKCSDSNDYGFNYLATVPVTTANEENMESSLSVSPEEPQYDAEVDSLTDTITVTSSIDNTGIDEDFVYYQWEVYRCGSADGTDCVTTDVYDGSLGETENIWLTKNCDVGEENETKDCGIETSSYLEGLGKNKIEFIPKSDVMKNSTEYFKVVLTNRKSESSEKKYISDIVIKVTQNDLGIMFYKITDNGDGTYSLGDEICSEGLYKELCPVYPYQTIGAKVSDADFDSVENYYWKLDGEAIDAPQECIFDSCAQGKKAYFLISGSNLDVSTLTVKAQKENGDIVTTQRLLSVNNPLANIVSNDYSTARPYEKFDGTSSEYVYNAQAGETASFRADLVPNYIDIGTISYKWFYDGTEVDDAYISDNSDLSFDVDSDNINFIIDDSNAASHTLSVEVEKSFSDEEFDVLDRAWGIDSSEINLLPEQKDVTIRTLESSSTSSEETASLGMFLASTAKNAPEYFIFILRLSVAIVLLGSLLYGANFITRLN